MGIFFERKSDSIIKANVIVVPYEGKITKHIAPTPNRNNIKSSDSIKTKMPDNCKHKQEKVDKCKVK